MKGKKAIKSVIGILAGIVLLAISATAQAALSPNLLSYSDFTATSNPITDRKTSGNLTTGQWYGSSTNWDWTLSSGDYFAKYTNTPSVEHLFQAVSISSAWPGQTATAGPVQVSFDYASYVTAASRILYVAVYGYASQPTGANYTSGALINRWNIALSTGTIAEQTFTGTVEATSGYAWYVIDFYTNGSFGGSSRYLTIDNVSLQVTPIPPAAWLLTTGLIGLVAIRRRFIS